METILVETDRESGGVQAAASDKAVQRPEDSSPFSLIDQYLLPRAPVYVELRALKKKVRYLPCLERDY